MTRLRDLPGLGLKTEQALACAGVQTVDDLKAIGPLMTFYRLRTYAMKDGRSGPSINFLYALVGAVEGTSWIEVARTQREQLLAELDSLEQMELLFA